MSLIKAIYVHLITKPKYNRLKICCEEEIRVREERTRERDVQININKIMQESFKNNVNKLVEENINLKKEIKQLKSKIRNKKKEEECEK